MKATKNILIFGGSGQIGSSLIRYLTRNNYKCTVVTRNIHQKGILIKTQGNAGFINVVEANIFDEKKIHLGINMYATSHPYKIKYANPETTLKAKIGKKRSIWILT